MPVDERGLVDRFRLTVVAAASFLLFVPALVLAILSALAVVLGPLGIGFPLAQVVVPATERLTALHRRVSGALLGRRLPPGYAATTGRGFVGEPVVWLRDPRRWRDFAFLAFSATGGAVLSGLPPLVLATPVTHLVGLAIDPSGVWLLLVALSLPCPLIWWLITPPLVYARARAEAGIFGDAQVESLTRRVDEVTSSRAEMLDHSAAEVRRIERDLHDGAQARIASVGMSVGLAEKLIATDPESAAALLREARNGAVSALEDLRSVVRGIHPPALADRGLAGGIEALALPTPLPVAVRVSAPPLPPPVESAAYFAVAECLANTVKHAQAARAWIRVDHDGQALRLVVGDDGRGGADPDGSGLTGVARRLAAFDGALDVDSPAGGPTVVTMTLPCRSGQ
ncbi:putative sensor protein [Couchioplanes caeruleus]|uniref:histidine kinase n=3 Tax=Couchioplanes caeruleus TaxID=56438 RepID=A0A1K0FQ83_9ACTN|nr:histidine kinase [Couchioplanes caeruleus subsp. caeruleus]ROP32168.1 putative sensor protein [Couchioplanes caeruleus]